MEAEAEKMKDKDKVVKDLIDWKNKSDNLIFSTEQYLEEFKNKLDKDLVKKITKKVGELQKIAKESEDPKEIKKVYEELDKLSSKIGEKMYQSQQQQQQGQD